MKELTTPPQTLEEAIELMGRARALRALRDHWRLSFVAQGLEKREGLLEKWERGQHHYDSRADLFEHSRRLFKDYPPKEEYHEDSTD